MASPATSARLVPQVELPEDPGLPDFSRLMDPGWVGSACEQLFPEYDLPPEQIRVRQISHTPDRLAIVSYVAEWALDAYLPSQQFIARVERDKPAETFRFPNDPDLPGLPHAVDPALAIELVNRHVLAVGARRLRVEVVRYRAGNRAVLRHSVGRMRFYARVMRPAAVRDFLANWEPIARSGFVAPRIAGCWSEGGVVWMSEIPGRNLRELILKDRQPDLAPILQGLATLWRPLDGTAQGQPFNLYGAYRRARRSLWHAAQGSATAKRHVREIAAALDPFVESWKPTATAHNDFYDDQILVLPDGGMALVDFEETGPGDPMLDAGNFTAHLRWRAQFGRRARNDATNVCLDAFRSAALERFGWDEHDLRLREAVCLFRVCTNVVRHPQADWRARLEAGLSLVRETLG